MKPHVARRLRAIRGLTLVELAIALAMLVTLATLATPSFADYLARHRVKAAAEALVADLAEARFLAAQRAQTTYLEFGGSSVQACWAVATTASCDCRVAQGCRVKATLLGQFRGVELVSAMPAAFSPEGRGSGAAELRSARGHRLRVEVSAMGRAHVCAPAGGDPRLPAC